MIFPNYKDSEELFNFKLVMWIISGTLGVVLLSMWIAAVSNEAYARKKAERLEKLGGCEVVEEIKTGDSRGGGKLSRRYEYVIKYDCKIGGRYVEKEWR